MSGGRSQIEAVLRAALYSLEAKNPLLVPFRYAGLPLPVRLVNGFSIPGPNVSREVAMSLLRFSYLGGELSTAGGGRVNWRVSFDTHEISTPQGIRFDLESFEPVIFAETYLQDVHNAGADLSDKIVIDAGAFVGDTALYFAQRGANVRAYEPDPENFRLLLRNLTLNPELAVRIRPFNSAVGNHGMMRVGVGLRGGSGPHAQTSRVVEVPSVSLEDVLEDCPGHQAFLLKADCKGAEFDFVGQPALTGFERLSIEYSADLRGSDIDALARQVETSGFSVSRIFKHNSFHYSLLRHGTIQADRVGAW